MITPDATWTTEAAKANGKPVYLVSHEYDYLKAQATTSADFQLGSGADSTNKLGSVICNASATDIMVDSSYGSTTKTVTAKVANNYYVLGCLLNIKTPVYINSLRFSCKSNSGTSQQFYTDVRKVNHSLDKNDSSGSFTVDSFGATGYIPRSNTASTSYSDFTVPMGLFQPGKYVVLIIPAYPSTSVTLQFETWFANQNIINNNLGLLGADLTAVTVGDFNATYDGDFSGFINGVVTDFSFTADSFDGYTILEIFSVQGYINSTYTSAWLPVNNSSGVQTTPTASGQVRLDYVKPINTSITFVLWWATDSSGTGATSLGAVVDGDTVSTLKDYYRIVASMTTTDWFSTPEILSLSVYFKLTNDYCKLDQEFIMASGLPARPYVDAIPSYETTIDPITNKVSFNQPTIDYIIQRKGMSNAQSDIEALAQSYFLTGKELAINIGWTNVSSANFIAYQTGVTDNQIYLNDNTLRIECKDQYFRTKDPYNYDAVTTFRPYFPYKHPSDIMLSLISASGIPQRLIDSSSFASMKTATGANSLVSWEFFRPYTEEIKDVKKEIDELCLLTGWIPVTKENGKIYAVNLIDSDSAVVTTLTNKNSKEVGKANIDLSKRVNACSVQRGYWIEPSDQVSEDIQYWDTAFDDASVNRVGRGEILKIENKWIPKDAVDGNGDNLSLVIARRIVNAFKYGLWTLKRSTNLSFAYVQIGDQISVTGEQILYKNFYGENTVRGVVIGKKINPSARNNEGEIVFTIWLYQNLYGGLTPQPAGYPTALVFSGVTSTNIDVSWTVNASANPTGHIVLRRSGSAPESKPESGTVYSVGNTIGDSTVEFVDAYTTLTFSDTVSADTKYYYAVFPYNGSGSNINYSTATPLIDYQWTNATEPTNHPSGLTFGTFADSSNTNVSWTASGAGTLAQGYLVLRRAGAAVSPDVPTDLNVYSVGDVIGSSTVVYFGSAVNFDDTGLSFSGVTYYYAVFPYRGSNAASYNYKTVGTPLNGSKATSVAAPSNQPTGFIVADTSSLTADAEWTDADPSVTGYVIFQKAGTSFTGAPVNGVTYTVGATSGDATCRFVGSGTSASLTSLSAGTNTFKIFAYNGGAGSETYLTISPPSQTLTISN